MRPLALLALAVLLTGCSTNREDQLFFGTGWLKPGQGADRRMYGNIKGPVPPGADEPAPLPPASRY